MARKPTYEELELRIAGLEEESAKSKRAEEVLCQSEERFREALDHVSAYIYMKDPQSRYVYANRVTLELFGCSAEELVGCDDTRFFPPDTVKRLREVDSRVFAGEQTSEEIDVADAGSGWRVYWEVKTPIYAEPERKTIWGLLGISTDITDRKRAEEALREKTAIAQTFMDALPCVALLLRPKTREIVALNKTAREAGARLGATCFGSWPKFDKACWFCRAPEAWETGVPQTLEVEALGIFWEAHWVPVTEELYLHYALDITERKQEEEELRRSESRFRGYFDMPLHGIAITSPEKDWIQINDKLCSILGYPRDELIHMTWQEMTHPDDLAADVEQFNRLLSGQIEQYSMDKRFIRKDGTVVWTNISVGCVRKSDGRVDYSIGLMEDITERKQAEKEKEKLQAQLNQAQKMEALGTLVAGVAHEINNPISLILFNAPLLRKIWHDLQPVLEEHALLEPQRKYGGLPYDFLKSDLHMLLADMELAGNRVATIVKGLKDFARKSDVKDKKPMALNEAIENALRLAQTTVRTSGVQLRVELGADLPAVVGNMQGIEQIVLNILINGVQAIQHDHGAIEVRTGYDEIRGGLTIHIRDNGEGIAPSLAGCIFDPFYTSRQAEGGTGLGLAVTYSLVEEHDGEISFESEVGKGTTFKVFFPVRVREKRYRVLLVDDEKLVLSVLSEVFSRVSRFDVETSESGTEALIKMGTWKPDVLILDFFMPGMDGLDVCRSLRRSPHLSQMKVIIITGHGDAPGIGEIRKLGYDRIFLKPLEIEEFVKEVEKMVEGEEPVGNGQ